MAAPTQGYVGSGYGVPPKRKRAAQPQEFFTYHPSSPKSHMKVPKGMMAQFVKDKGWHAVAKKLAGGLQGGTSRPTTSQARTTIETPAQIEERVSRMAKATYDRQKGDLDAEAERMRREAEGRRLGMIDAYKAAGQSDLGAQVQSAWQQAAGTLSGLAGETSGGIADALQADLATQEAALARVGAGGTGFDARGQHAVEAYRGGYLPAEAMTRQGAVGHEYLLKMADNLQKQGLQTGYSQENQTLAEINADRLAAIAKLGTERTTYESELRKEFTGAREKQIEAQTDAKIAATKAKSDADKLVLDMKQAQAKLDQQYAIAKMNATTKKEISALDQIYKSNKLEIDRQTASALATQRHANADLAAARIDLVGAQTNLAGVKAADIKAHPGTGGGTKTPKVKTVSDIVKDAAVRVGQGGMNLQPRRVRAKTGPKKGQMVDVPYKQILFEYLWSIYGDAVPKKQQSVLKRKLIDFAYSAPRPKDWGGDIFS